MLPAEGVAIDPLVAWICKYAWGFKIFFFSFFFFWCPAPRISEKAELLLRICVFYAFFLISRLLFNLIPYFHPPPAPPSLLHPTVPPRLWKGTSERFPLAPVPVIPRKAGRCVFRALDHKRPGAHPGISTSHSSGCQELMTWLRLASLGGPFAPGGSDRAALCAEGRGVTGRLGCARSPSLAAPSDPSAKSTKIFDQLLLP